MRASNRALKNSRGRCRREMYKGRTERNQIRSWRQPGQGILGESLPMALGRPVLVQCRGRRKSVRKVVSGSYSHRQRTHGHQYNEGDPTLVRPSAICGDAQHFGFRPTTLLAHQLPARKQSPVTGVIHMASNPATLEQSLVAQWTRSNIPLPARRFTFPLRDARSISPIGLLRPACTKATSGKP